MFSERPTGFTSCFSHVNTIFQSFFKKVSYRFTQRRICLRAKVRILVFIICPLLVGIDCVTDKTKATFSFKKKHALLSSNLVPRMPKNRIFRALKFQTSLGRNALRPPPPIMTFVTHSLLSRVCTN